MKTIFIMLDSLNLHYLSTYGNSWVKTPNIDRLAKRGITFDNHYVCSAPCMPARRDFMTGRHSFLESPWGPLEPYDPLLTNELRRQTKTYSHLITDHYHYWEIFAHGYHCAFDTWEFIRGQEGDPWHPSVRDPEIPRFRGKNRRQDWINRSKMDMENEEAYPTPQCFKKAIDFLENNGSQDNWFLQLECFDPHEPFVCPTKYRDLYDDDWDGGYLYDWPEYKALDPEKDDPAAVEHIRKCYAGTLSMADAWLGKLLDKMDEMNLWESTTILFGTDHGHLLGEHGYWAKNHMFDYNRLMHIPMILCSPYAKGGERRGALTSAIDIMPTILELQGASVPETVHGKSLLHLVEKDGPHHDAVLYGYFAKDIGMRFGDHVYCRRPAPESITYHHTAMPVNAFKEFGMKKFRDAEVGKFLKHSEMPVYRVPIERLSYKGETEEHRIYNIALDPEQENIIRDASLDAELAAKMKSLLLRYDAPECQMVRTGLV